WEAGVRSRLRTGSHVSPGDSWKVSTVLCPTKMLICSVWGPCSSTAFSALGPSRRRARATGLAASAREPSGLAVVVSLSVFMGAACRPVEDAPEPSPTSSPRRYARGEQGQSGPARLLGG